VIKPNAPVGCVNGGGIYDYDKEEYVSLLTLPDDVADLVIEVAEHVEGIGVVVHTPNTLYFPYDNAATVRHRARTKMEYQACDLRNFTETIAKIVFADMREEAIEKAAAFLNSHKRADEFGFIRSERTLYEILPKGISKGTLLSRLAEHLGIDMKKTVAVGDYNNDVSMIAAAGVGVAVANAVPEAKAVAKHITVSNEEHAIARIISDIEEGLIRFS
jgi:Cof subfamily protein (haloacid dehalogenase superfamily)